jgi:tetratricopeptide (TPR) repeat protein
MDPNPQDMPDLMGRHDPLGDAITVALVLVTLLAAVVGWRQAHAVFEHEEAAVRAEEWTVLASSQHARANQVEWLQRARRWQARRARIGAAQSAARASFGQGHRFMLALEARESRGRARRADRESRRLTREGVAELGRVEADAAAAVPDIHPSLGRTASCEARPRYGLWPALAAASGRGPPSPAEYEVGMRREAFRMEGLRDAAAETAAQAEEQFTRYAISLAAIAVALFLFGYALTKYGFRFRRIFACVGALLTAFSVYIAVTAFFDAPSKPPPAAAAAYADGRIALERGQLEVALRDLACATKLNPGFADAYLLRSRAFDQRGMPRDVAVIDESLASGRNLLKALRFGRRALQLDSEDPLALAQIATALYVHGIRHRDRQDLLRAVAVDRRVQAALPRDPIPALNTATVLLALGRPWRTSYRRAERLMDEASAPLEYVGPVLTDLLYLQASGVRPGIAAAASAAKAQLIAAISRRTPTASGATATYDGAERAALSGVRLGIAPASVYLSFAGRGFRPGRDRLFVAVYGRQPLGWQELPHVSGPVTGVGAPAHGRYAITIWSSSPTYCLGSDAYRVELYVNGHLATGGGPVGGVTASLPQMRRRRLANLDLGLCYPSGEDWRPIARRAAGLLDGFERPGHGGREGIAVFDVSESRARGALPIGATLLGRFSPPLPRGARPAGAPSGVVPVGNLVGARETAYAYRNGFMILVTATTPIGRKLAIAVFGPPAFFASPSGSAPSLGASVLESVFTYDLAPTQG